MNEHTLNLISDLVQKREKLLMEKPHLRPIQDKIDATLEAIGDNPKQRCEALSTLLIRSFHDLNSHLKDLEQYILESKLDEKLSNLRAKYFDTKSRD